MLRVKATGLARLCTWHCSNARLCLAGLHLKHRVMGEGTVEKSWPVPLTHWEEGQVNNQFLCLFSSWVLLLPSSVVPPPRVCLFMRCFSHDMEPPLWWKLRFPGLGQVHGRGPVAFDFSRWTGSLLGLGGTASLGQYFLFMSYFLWGGPSGWHSPQAPFWSQNPEECPTRDIDHP